MGYIDSHRANFRSEPESLSRLITLNGIVFTLYRPTRTVSADSTTPSIVLSELRFCTRTRPARLASASALPGA
jgi:hypothetical protein